MCLLAVSPDGDWLAASGTSAGVHVYSLKNLKVSAEFPNSGLSSRDPRQIGVTWKFTRLFFFLTKNFSSFRFLFYFFGIQNLYSVTLKSVSGNSATVHAQKFEIN
jgi:hypothetical protein